MTLQNESDSYGFTFIELMMVITIMGTLAALSVPNFHLSKYYGRIYLNEGLILSKSVRNQIIDYYEFTGQFPADNETIGLPSPEAIRGKYIESIAVKDGAIDILLNQDVSMGYAGEILTIRPAISKADPTGAVIWIQGKDAVPQGLKVIGTNNTTLRLPPLNHASLRNPIRISTMEGAGIVKRISLLTECQRIVEYGCSIAVLLFLLGFSIKIFAPAYTLSITSHINPVFPMLRNQLIYYHALHGVWPADRKELSDLTDKGAPIWKNSRYIHETTIEDGAVHYTFGKALPGRILTLRPAVSRDNPLGPVNWVCGNKKRPSQWTVFGIDRTNISPHSINKIWRH